MILPLNLNEVIETRVSHQEAALARGGVAKAPRFTISEAVIYGLLPVSWTPSLGVS
jgi:hypothetical protein